MKKISDFSQITTRNNDDWLLIEEASTGAYKRIKVSDFITDLSSGGEEPATPTNILDIFGQDLIAWFRADNAIMAGNRVSQWTDLSGNNNHAVQPDSNKYPYFTQDGFNGKPAIIFNNLDVWFSLPDCLNSSWGEASLFIVYELQNTTQHWDATATGSNNNCYWGTNNVFNYAGYFGEFRASRLEGQPVNMTVAGKHFIEVVSGTSSNSYRLFRDGANLLTTNPAWGVRAIPYIGRAADSKRMNGNIAEIFIAKKAATDSQRISCQNYVKDFWGLAW
jgi:hypothetical protein